MKSSRLVLLCSSFLFSLSAVSAQAAEGKHVRTKTAPAPVVQSTEISAPAAVAETHTLVDVGHGFHFDAFADVEGRATNKDWIADRGFTLNDGAFFVEKDLGDAMRAFLELPFYSSGATNSLNFATGHAQAYFAMNHEAWGARVGQFESIFGIEANDSRDRFFADPGWIKTEITPTTHMGVLGQYNYQNFQFRGLLDDPSDTTTMARSNPEIGAQARMEASKGYGSAGILYSEGKNQTGNSTNLLIDVIGGTKLDRFHIDGSFDAKRVSGYDKTGYSYGVLGTYAMRDDLGLGVRLEFLNNPVMAAGGAPTGQLDWAYSVAFGPSYKYNSAVTFRGDLSGGAFHAAGGTDEPVFALTVSMVAHL